MVIGLLTFIHVIVCALLIVVVLLQKGKGQDFASTFGGGGTQTAFGARSGATILHRATTAAAIIFMLTSLTLTILLSRSGQESVLGDGVTVPATTTQPPVSLPLPPVDDEAPGIQDAAVPAVEVGEPVTADEEGASPEE